MKLLLSEPFSQEIIAWRTIYIHSSRSFCRFSSTHSSPFSCTSSVIRVHSIFNSFSEPGMSRVPNSVYTFFRLRVFMTPLMGNRPPGFPDQPGCFPGKWRFVSQGSRIIRDEISCLICFSQDQRNWKHQPAVYWTSTETAWLLCYFMVGIPSLLNLGQIHLKMWKEEFIIEAWNGAVVRLGRAAGVSVSLHACIYLWQPAAPWAKSTGGAAVSDITFRSRNSLTVGIRWSCGR